LGQAYTVLEIAGSATAPCGALPASGGTGLALQSLPGEDTDAVLSTWLGLSDTEIQGYRERGAPR
jgi:hypothetical protein